MVAGQVDVLVNERRRIELGLKPVDDLGADKREKRADGPHKEVHDPSTRREPTVPYNDISIA